VGPAVPLTTATRLRAAKPLLEPDGSCGLLYDLERTLVIEVPPELADRIEPAVRLGDIDDALAAWLRDEDLLTSDPPPRWSEGSSPRLPALTDVSMDMSGACNMGCTYCFENDINSRIGAMSYETAMATIDFALANAPPGGRIAFHFGSGEPLLRFDLLRHIVAEARGRGAASGHDVGFELTTNATLVKPEVAAFLADEGFNVRVSCDGPAEVHDRFRPMRSGRPSYAAVEAGMRLLLEYLPDRVTVNSVISGGTRLIEVWRWAQAMGVRHYHVIKVGAFGDRDLNLRSTELADFRTDLEAVCDDLLAELEAGRRPIDYQPITKIVRRLMIPQPVTRFCGVAGSYLGVASDGQVYPCFRHLGLDEHRLGNVWEGVDHDHRRSFLGNEAADVDARPVCQDCWARYLCGGGCYADSTVYGPDKRKPQVQHCPFWRTEIDVAIRFYNRLLRTDPRLCLILFGDEVDLDLDTLGDNQPEFLRRQNCQ